MTNKLSALLAATALFILASGPASAATTHTATPDAGLAIAIIVPTLAGGLIAITYLWRTIFFPGALKQRKGPTRQYWA